jgi:hypothetical protein
VIDDSIIEQATDFKYLGYRISENKSDLEDHHHHHHHHKHPGLGHLARSVSRITVALSIVSSVSQLQTYNKVNGAIRRHFGKQMNKES